MDTPSVTTESRLTLATMLVLLFAFFSLVVNPSAVLAQESEVESGGEAGESEAEEHSETEGEPNILEAQPTLAVYTLIVFLIVLGVLRYYAWGPLSKALAEREARLEENFQKAEEARAAAAALLEKHQRQMEEAQDQVRQIMEDARIKAQAAYDQRLEQARTDAEQTATRARSEISLAKEQAITELYTKSAEAAVQVAGQVLRKEISEDEHRRLILMASEELQAVGTTNGQGGKLG